MLETGSYYQKFMNRKQCNLVSTSFPSLNQHQGPFVSTRLYDVIKIAAPGFRGHTNTADTTGAEQELFELNQIAQFKNQGKRTWYRIMDAQIGQLSNSTHLGVVTMEQMAI